MSVMTGLGRTWWGKQWIQTLEAFGEQWPNRLPRGRGYASAGRVRELVIESGGVMARVEGSGVHPYRVDISVGTYTDQQWERLLQELARQARYAIWLLQGEMPDHLPQVCAQLGLALLPQGEGDLEARCTCPDLANPCKHVAAVLYCVGFALDRDPFLLLALRGRTRGEIMAALQALRGQGQAELGAEVAEPDADDLVDLGTLTVGEYWRAQAPMDAVRFDVGVGVQELESLRRLGAPPSWGDPETFLALFRSVYEDAAELAVALARGGGLHAWREERRQEPMAEVAASREEEAPADSHLQQSIPKFAAVCQWILALVSERGYVAPKDREQFDEGEQALFRLALQALVLEGQLVREGSGARTRYVLSS